MSRDSEFRTYKYIDDVLSSLNWDTRNPGRGGSVYTQGEFYNEDMQLTAALQTARPENIILIPWERGPRYWVVEAKRRHQDRQKALEEAIGYADKINDVSPNSARFATGVAGTPENSFFVTTVYWDGNSWTEVRINNFSTTGFLTSRQCIEILDQNDPRILSYSVNSELFLEKAKHINEILQKNNILARDRSRLVAGLLLALVEDSAMRISSAPMTLVSDINSRVKTLLAEHGKSEYASDIKLKLPATDENHKKYWTAIVQTLQDLREINIRSAINSDTDALGQFYETFLKYANDANEVGVVLTPRHITRFAVEVMKVTESDIVFDPACGTGGFLVASLDKVRQVHYQTHRDVYDEFRNDNLYGVEQSDEVFALALVNMIFRGDGKSKIFNGNCFDNEFIVDDAKVKRLYNHHDKSPSRSRPFTRVLMNPPFAQTEKESEFVDYALRQMKSPIPSKPFGGSFLFAILPNDPIIGKSESEWRKELLRHHTVRAVIKLPNDLFQPQASKGTYAIILEAWRRHQASDRTFFGIMYDDKTASSKPKTLGTWTARDNVSTIQKELTKFLWSKRSKIAEIPEELCVGKVSLGGGGGGRACARGVHS